MATERRVPDTVPFKLTRGAVFPLIGGRSTWSQEHLLPIFVTLLVGIALFAVPFPWPHISVGGKPIAAELNEAWQVFLIIALYIAFMANYYVNQMCGRARPGWLLAVVAFFTFLLLFTPFWHVWAAPFYVVIPGERLEKSSSAVANVAGYLFGTGLCEEGFKALPLLGLALLGAALRFLGRHGKGRLGALWMDVRRRIGLCEPLDGIVFGVASGSGFFIYETLVLYVPKVMHEAKLPAAQAFNGLVLLLARGLPELTEHSAWAGLFGYFIGLSVLRPGMAIFLLPLGWLSAAALHGAWDSIGSLFDSGFVIVPLLIVDGVLGYALLAGAIFKARDISPRLAAARAAARARPAAAAVSPTPVSPTPVSPTPATAPLGASDPSDWD